MKINNADFERHFDMNGWNCSYIANNGKVYDLVVEGEYKGEHKVYHSVSQVKYLKSFPKDVLAEIVDDIEVSKGVSLDMVKVIQKDSKKEFEAKIMPMIENLRKAMGDEWEYISDSEFGSYFVSNKSGLEIPFEI